MKKNVAILLVLLAFIAVPMKGQIKWGVKGGVNISKVHFNLSDLNKDAKSSTGFQIGPMAEFKIPILGLGVETAILYSQKGYEDEGKSLNSDFLDIPINLKWKFGLPVVPVKPYVLAGPNFDFKLSTPKELKGQFDSKTFGVGINLGAGVEVFKHLQVGFNYLIGVTNNYTFEAQDINIKNRTWSITAAILF